MTPEELEQGKEWARRWREAGPLLEQIRQEELLQMTPQQRRAASLAVLDLGAQFRQPRTTSGLVVAAADFHASAAMTPLLAAGLELQSFFQKRGWEFCVIGGLAVHRWGNPRATQDVNLTLLTGFGSEESFVDAILGHFPPRRPDSKEFALQVRVLLINASNGIPVDIALGAFLYEERAVRRATPYEFAPGCTLVTVSAEDLVVSKAFANRDQDWVDLHDIVLLQNKRLDWAYVVENLTALGELKEDNQPVDRLAALRTKFKSQPKPRRKKKG